MIKRRALLAFGALLPAGQLFAARESLAPLAARFIDMMVARHGFDKAEMEGIFASLQTNPDVVELIKPPEQGGRKVFWDEYRARHVTTRNIGNGIVFATKHSDALSKAARDYGVPPEIVTAIIGVETRYGTFTGKYRSLETLATLAFTYPPRADYFTREMEQLFLYARSSNVDVLSLRGSYAGAMGFPQFMPTSARVFAVDFDNDGKVDLFDPIDAIGSVGNFLAEHGWEKGVPVAFPVQKKENAMPAVLLDAGIVPSLTHVDFSSANMPVDFGDANVFAGKLSLVDLENESKAEYRAGTINYYALTRYNRSNKYAMTVLDLAREIKRRI